MVSTDLKGFKDCKYLYQDFQRFQANWLGIQKIFRNNFSYYRLSDYKSNDFMWFQVFTSDYKLFQVIVSDYQWL